jgi:predicted metalloprotease
MPIMRFTPLLASCTLFWLMLSGTAHAVLYPVNDPVLTKNKLYRSGKLKPSECPERDIKQNDVPSAKRYLTSVLNCLNASWAVHLKQSGLPFARARIGFITKPQRFCGHTWGKKVAARYCSAERRFLVLLNDDLLDDPSDLYLFQVAAHEYGHHIQSITGMDRAFQHYPYKGNSELNEQLRRNELQAECLGGAFTGSVWNSLDRTEKDWEELLDITRDSGDEWTKIRDHGKGHNIVAWLDKGFHAASPAVCNTWTAPTSKVS